MMFKYWLSLIFYVSFFFELNAQHEPTKNYLIGGHFINTKKGAFVPYIVFRGYTVNFSNVVYYYILYPSQKIFLLVSDDGIYQVGTFKVEKHGIKKYQINFTPKKLILHELVSVEKFNKFSVDSFYFDVKIKLSEPILDLAKKDSPKKGYFSRVHLYDVSTGALKFSTFPPSNGVDLVENVIGQTIQTTIALPRFSSEKVQIYGICPIWGALSSIPIDVDTGYNYYKIHLEFCNLMHSSLFSMYSENFKKTLIVNCETLPCTVEDESGKKLKAHQMYPEHKTYILLYSEYIRLMNCLQNKQK